MPIYANNTVAGVPSTSELYYNIYAKNNNTQFDTNGNPVAGNVSVPLVFDETRAQPYIDFPADYEMSVINFQSDTNNIPVFIAEPVAGANDINKTIYYVSITNYDGTTVYTKCVEWVPQDLTAPVPPSPVPVNYTSFPYYFCYSYDYFIQLINQALASISPTTNPPFLTIDDNNNICLKAPKTEYFTGYNGFCGPSGWQVYFNTELYSLFSSLNAVKEQNAEDYRVNLNYRMIFYENPSGLNTEEIYTDLTAVPITSGSSFTALVNRCEYSPVAFWNPVESIQFWVYQLYVAPELFGTNSVYQNNPTADQYYLLTDYSAESLKIGTELHPSIYYEPIAEYKFSSLFGIQPLTTIKIVVNWKDKWGITHPLLLEAGGVASIKILFRKKIML